MRNLLINVMMLLACMGMVMFAISANGITFDIRAGFAIVGVLLGSFVLLLTASNTAYFRNI